MAATMHGRLKEDTNGAALTTLQDPNAQPSAMVNQVSRLKIRCCWTNL